MIASYRKKIKIILLMSAPLVFFSTNTKQGNEPEISVNKIIQERTIDVITQDRNKFKMLTKINLSYLDWKLAEQEAEKNKK